MTDVAIRDLTAGDAPSCDEIIAGLPHFFGDADGVRDCAAAVRSQPGVVATIDGRVVGFVTVLRHHAESAEITWMAVHAEHRRRGIGTVLMEAVVRQLSDEGVRMLSVLTAAESMEGPEVADGYEGPRRFYRSQGFVPVRDVELRSWNSRAALMLARAL